MKLDVAASASAAPRARRLPVGAELIDESVAFRVWAPEATRVHVVLEGPSPQSVELAAEGAGYFSTRVAAARAGHLYCYRLDGRSELYPDPASRFQPQGPHGPSQIVDPAAFAWTDDRWSGVAPAGHVLCEIHIGTFTREGTWRAARAQLADLAETGVTIVEVMPVADFPGRFGWGYDGVDLFAPSRLYGEPDAFKAFVDHAHHLGLGVILDVVYNHLGPEGAYLRAFSPDYFTNRYDNEWGAAINFDGPNSGPVREFFLSNARYWIEEYHLDGLRLDATQQIFDRSPEHILAAIAREVRTAGRGRPTLLVAENERQHTRLLRSTERGGYGIGALWNEDFHHAAVVAVTGHREAYYSDYRGTAQELVSALKHGFLYQGQRSAWQRQSRGTPTGGLPASAFINFIENHDQVANSASGQRLVSLTSPGRYRAITAVLLLGPGTPMLFQGQEYGSTRPFRYFADFAGALADGVRRGRRSFLSQFSTLDTSEAGRRLPDPIARATFEACQLDRSESERNPEVVALYRDLLRLRRQDPVLRSQGRHGVDGAVLGPEAFVLRLFGEGGDDRLLLVNLGVDLACEPAPEPLLAPSLGTEWELLWSSEHVRYSGGGARPVTAEGPVWLPGHAAVVLRLRAARIPAHG